MKTLIVIPARYASTRLPGKPLLADTGKPLIQHVYEQAKASKVATDVIVATDDQRIEEAVKAFGGQVMMTSPDHSSGSDRIAEVVQKTETPYDVVVNVQGDEPEVEPEAIDLLATLQYKSRPFMSTLACPFSRTATQGSGSPADPNCVKVILGHSLEVDNTFNALYFSRSLMPYPREAEGTVEHPEQYYLHIGMYAYSPESILGFSELPAGKLEQTEHLEQLRVLESGKAIHIGLIDEAAAGVDTPEDYEAFVQRWQEKSDLYT